MKITDIRLCRINAEGRVKAIASITLDNEFVIHDIRIMNSKNGLFVAMPSKRTPEGTFRDIVHPLTSAMRETIQGLVLKEYLETYEMAGNS